MNETEIFYESRSCTCVTYYTVWYLGDISWSSHMIKLWRADYCNSDNTVHEWTNGMHALNVWILETGILNCGFHSLLFSKYYFHMPLSKAIISNWVNHLNHIIPNHSLRFGKKAIITIWKHITSAAFSTSDFPEINSSHSMEWSSSHDIIILFLLEAKRLMWLKELCL